MKLHTVFVTAIVAGSACPVTLAGNDSTTPLRYGGRITPIAMYVNGVAYPVRIAGGDVPQVVYDNGTTATGGFFYTTSIPNQHIMDQMTFTPGPGAGQPVLLTSMTVPLSTQATVVNPTNGVDLLVAVWNDTNAANSPVNTQQAGDTIRLAFAAPAEGWAPNTIYISNPVDLTTLPGGGLQTTDDNVGVEFSYMVTDAVPPAGYNTDFTVGFWGDSSLGMIPNPGNSDPTYWRDVSGDAIFQGPTETRQFAAPILANFVMGWSGEVGGTPPPTCYPNCDHSTTIPFLNVLDFNCFLNAFTQGQSYANCDLSTTPPVLNVLDFNCFLNAFTTGCSAP
jgi:hypothetical protein